MLNVVIALIGSLGTIGWGISFIEGFIGGVYWLAAVSLVGFLATTMLTKIIISEEIYD